MKLQKQNKTKTKIPDDRSFDLVEGLLETFVNSSPFLQLFQSICHCLLIMMKLLLPKIGICGQHENQFEDNEHKPLVCLEYKTNIGNAPHDVAAAMSSVSVSAK